MGFIDDVVKGVNTGIKSVGDAVTKVQSKSQEMMHNVSQQNRITALQAKKEVALQNLGKLVYDKYEKGDEVGDDVLKRKTTEIAEIEKEIELIKEEIETYKAEHGEDVPLAQKSESKAGYNRTPGFCCPHCEAPANHEKLFCAFCGGELSPPEKSASGSEEKAENGADVS